jgi:hypothetical protein
VGGSSGGSRETGGGEAGQRERGLHGGGGERTRGRRGDRSVWEAEGKEERLEPMCWDKAVRPGPNLLPNTACAHLFATNLRKTRGRSTDKPLTRRHKRAQPRNGIYQDARTCGPSGISGRSWQAPS